MEEPRLDGRKLVFTVAVESSFLDVSTTADGSFSYSGYLVDMMQAIARPDRANFTLEFRPPSGFGPDCISSNNNKNDSSSTTMPYGKAYWRQYNCATNDVELVNSTFQTDGYAGLFYASLDRLQKFRLTIPYNPPYKGTPAMFGSVTGLPTIESVVGRQKQDTSLHVCVPGSTATLDLVRSVYPELRITEVIADSDDIYEALSDGSCSIFLFDAPVGNYMVRLFSEQGKCLINGRPIGLIGEPMEFGLSHYSIGISKEQPIEVSEVISYWMTYLMTCNPMSECPDGNLATFYNNRGGTGSECGYELYPSKLRMETGEIVAIAIGCLFGLLFIFCAVHRRRMIQQERRYKKRFVQQIARNIEIGPSPGSIPPTKLSEQIMHISKHKGVIGKEDLRQWLLDIKMTFISDKDFDALWSAMDIGDRGVVDPVQFIVFLSACGPQFEEVYKEQAALPKYERLKLAARRLSNISRLGEDGVRKLERKLENTSAGKRRPIVADRASATSTEFQYDLSHIDETETEGAE